MFNTNTAHTRTSSWMRLKPSGRRVAIVDEHIPGTKCTPPEVHSEKNVGKQNHWVEVCRSRQQPQRMSRTHLPTTKQQPMSEHSVVESPCNDPKELYFSPVTVSTVTRDEALTHISVKLPTHSLNTACMRVKVHTGVQCNVLTLKVFSGMFPEYMDNNITKVSVLEQYNNTKLTAYNGTRIPHYGTITLKCWKKDRPCFLYGQHHRARYYWAPE